MCGTLPSTPPVELVGGMSSLSWEWFDHLSRAFFSDECQSPGCMVLWFCPSEIAASTVEGLLQST